MKAQILLQDISGFRWIYCQSQMFSLKMQPCNLFSRSPASQQETTTKKERNRKLRSSCSCSGQSFTERERQTVWMMIHSVFWAPSLNWAVAPQVRPMLWLFTTNSSLWLYIYINIYLYLFINTFILSLWYRKPLAGLWNCSQGLICAFTPHPHFFTVPLFTLLSPLPLLPPPPPPLL